MNAPQPRDDLDDWYPGPGDMLGYASTLPIAPQDDPVERLHQVVEEVTGKPVQRAEKPRIGFL